MTKESNIFVGTVVVEDGKVLMIKEGKNNYGQRGTWNFPAGHAEENESLKQAAVREAIEESGFKVKLDGVLAIQKNALHLVVFFAGSRVDDKAVDTEEGTDEVRLTLILIHNNLLIRGNLVLLIYCNTLATDRGKKRLLSLKSSIILTNQLRFIAERTKI